jgi:HKD family nuclease
MAKSVGTFELIENAGPNSVLATLKTLLKSAIEVDVQVAFTTLSGVELLMSRLLSVAGRGDVRFLTGLYQGNTEPAALTRLHKEQERHGRCFQVRLSSETNFHRKAILIHTKSTLHAVIGSSNFSKNGMLSAGELSALVSAPAETSKANVIKEVFRSAWDEGVALDKSLINEYAAVRPKRQESVAASALKSILGAAAKYAMASAPSVNDTTTDRSTRKWIDGVAGQVAAETLAVLHDETNWDGKWDSRSCNDGYRAGDEVVLLDRTSKPGWAALTHITATTRTATKTPDGRHFVAYRFIPRSGRRKMTPAFMARLRSVGVTRTDGGRAVISKAAWVQVRDLFAR